MRFVNEGIMLVHVIYCRPDCFSALRVLSDGFVAREGREG